jgi:hypothetical protein
MKGKILGLTYEASNVNDIRGYVTALEGTAGHRLLANGAKVWARRKTGV